MVRVGTEDSGGELMVADLYVPPGTPSTPFGEHYYPVVEEYLTVVRGRVGLRLDGIESVAEAGERVEVPPGTPHQWWNAGQKEAHVIVEVRPAGRFEEMVVSLFGLAREGKTDTRGTPGPTDLALFAREFEDVVVFTRMSPPSSGGLARIAKASGHQSPVPGAPPLQSGDVPQDAAGEERAARTEFASKIYAILRMLLTITVANFAGEEVMPIE